MNAPNDAWKSEAITQAQHDYIVGLAEGKVLTSLSLAQQLWLSNPDNFENLNKGQADKLIQTLKALDWKPKQHTTSPPNTTQAPNPPHPVQSTQATQSTDGGVSKEGRYFIVDPTDGVEKFVHVTVHVRASDTLYPINDPTHRNEMLGTIAKDPINAMNEYGIRLGICGCCGRTLTNVDSRLKGIGPICASRLSTTPTAEDLDKLRKIGLIK
jgi:Family of unknown function (DUF6011)